MHDRDKILFFDGHCGLCDRFVSFLFKRDKAHRLLYAPLQGSTAESVLSEPMSELPDSVVFLSNQKIYTKSDAVLHALSAIGRGFQLMKIFLVVPSCIRNWIYDKIAQNRYRIFGKTELCRIPTNKERKYFLP